MKIHHLNCATMCPPVGPLLNAQGKMVCHCLLIETGEGLVLVDTGLGTADVARPRERLGGLFCAVTRPAAQRHETALSQIEALGLSPKDVRHILVTHLDLDHAGGLPDFPEATVHVHEEEYRAAMWPSLRERERYRKVHFAHWPRWSRHRPGGGERWMGFECVRDLPGLPKEILMVPLPGHTRGHCAIAARDESGWILHCGDAYFYEGEMDPALRRCTPALDLFQRLVEIDPEARRGNQHRLRQLVRDKGAEVRVFCAHDPAEFDRLAGAS